MGTVWILVAIAGGMVLTIGLVIVLFGGGDKDDWTS